MGKITALAHDRLSAAERFKQTLMALSRQDTLHVLQLTTSCPVLTWEGPDRAFTERLRGAERLTYVVAADLSLALGRYTVIDELSRTLTTMGQITHDELKLAWELGHQSAPADGVPEVALQTLLDQHDNMWARGQSMQQIARDEWGRLAHSLWASWESFTRTAWRVAPDVPFRAWLPTPQVDDEILQPIKTLKKLTLDTESQDIYRAMLEHAWQQTLNLIA